MYEKARDMLASEVAQWPEVPRQQRPAPDRHERSYGSSQANYPQSPSNFEQPFEQLHRQSVAQQRQGPHEEQFLRQPQEDPLPRHQPARQSQEDPAPRHQPPRQSQEEKPLPRHQPSRQPQEEPLNARQAPPRQSQDLWTGDSKPAMAPSLRRRIAEAQQTAPNSNGADGSPRQGLGQSLRSSGTAPPPRKLSSQRGPGEVISNTRPKPNAVAAWIRALPSSQVPEKQREALACSVEAEGLDSDSFTKVAHEPSLLAQRGLPSPAHALKVRRAWEQVLREDACRQIAMESATSAKATPKAVKMVF